MCKIEVSSKILIGVYPQKILNQRYMRKQDCKAIHWAYPGIIVYGNRLVGALL